MLLVRALTRIEVLIRGSVHCKLKLDSLARLAQDLSLFGNELDLHSVVASWQNDEDGRSEVHTSAHKLGSLLLSHYLLVLEDLDIESEVIVLDSIDAHYSCLL